MPREVDHPDQSDVVLIDVLSAPSAPDRLGIVRMDAEASAMTASNLSI